MLCLDLAQSVRRELCYGDVGISISDIHGVIVVNEETCVVPAVVDGRAFGPWSPHGRGSVHIGFSKLDATSPIEQAVAFTISEEGSPDTFDISSITVRQVIIGRPVKNGHRVSGKFPVDEIVGAKDGCTRRQMEARG